MECDDSINEACEMLGSFELIEEVINSIFGIFLMNFKLVNPCSLFLSQYLLFDLRNGK